MTADEARRMAASARLSRPMLAYALEIVGEIRNAAEWGGDSVEVRTKVPQGHEHDVRHVGRYLQALGYVVESEATGDMFPSPQRVRRVSW